MLILLPFLHAATVLGALAINLEKRLAISNQGIIKRDQNTEFDTETWFGKFTFGSQKAQVDLRLNFYVGWTNLNSSDSYCHADRYNTSRQICELYNTSELSSFLSAFSDNLNTTIYKDLVSFEGFETEVEYTKIDRLLPFFGLGLGTPYFHTPRNTSNYSHDNFVQALKKQGSIDSSVYSLWANPANGSTDGQLVIGGVDESKYNGSLYRTPIIHNFSDTGSNYNFGVRLASFHAKDQNLELPVAVLLWPDVPQTLLPTPYIDALFKAYGKRTKKGYIIEQKVLDRNETISFSFGKFNLSVPLSSVAGYETDNNGPKFYTTFNNYSDVFWLGSDVLKHAYISIDYDNWEVALGQSLPFTGELKIVNATSGFDGIAEDGGSETSLAVHFYSTSVAGVYPSGVSIARTTGSFNGGSSFSSPIVSLLSLLAGILLI